MKSIKARDIMTPKPRMIKPTQTVQEAAEIMKEEDFGVLPVGTPEAVIGVITDRDITVRVTATGKDASKTPVQDVMTKKFISCNETDEIEHAAELMRHHDVSRVMVLRFDKASNYEAITGIITMADLLRNKGDRHKSDKVLHELLKPAHLQKQPSAREVAMADATPEYEGCDI